MGLGGRIHYSLFLVLTKQKHPPLRTDFTFCLFDPQYLQDVDEEVAEMTKKKQRDCEVGSVVLPGSQFC